ncbi:helix-turn-helix transcriptional regulator [Helicobacter pylori]|uniref:heat shock protein transcriptional repressor HspR n=1 Tax=Helicobacter pylori TaxID=210 RepID=UPI00042E9B58|nr:helix-turn-helix transcriptional regulator [Helicobacter pylori]AHN35943.1 MerR family transcriptional regulator [Helicobacter pylori oki112]AHN40250.1 MerR family transcriptional regulator [Helicobacter pylori oki422]AHN44611.1 MerR family transcriptional regulator [Helicobacter pylori oki898]WRA48400.1 helix-turn-helix transcriptional regulator [Helicobacter pylori]WRB95440.1 helix-turn-helix transcriptional regulator [Helicobacter pylori]
MCDYDEPLYLISVVAKILGVHPQTLRQYEKEGLIEPSRTDGKMRLYSQRDMDKIKTILRLTRDMGVNLAGVDIILRLKEKLDELDNLNKELQDALQKHSKNTKTPMKNLNTPMNFYELILFKK